MKYPAIEQYCNADDKLIAENGSHIANVLDFWKWAYSNVLDNAERGIFAEYLVSIAVNSCAKARENWAKYDVISEEGITIEVKTSAFIQTWGQEKLSSIRFGIAETQGYDKNTNSYEKIKKRQAQVYVFCLQNATNQESINVLDMSQWEFYVLPSAVLNNSPQYKNSSSIGIQALMKLGARKCTFRFIHETVRNSVTY